MKIKYSICEKTTLDKLILKERILSQLAKDGYLIESVSNEVISFKDDFWQLRPKGELLRKVDRGIFSLSSSDKVSTVKYTYYISFLAETGITFIILIGALALSLWICLIALPFWLQFYLRVYNLKTISKFIISRLIN